MTDTSVKFFNEKMPGAPTLNGTPGAALAVIDACLRTGFGQRQITSLVVSGDVATITTANEAGNVELLHSVIAVSGITGALAALNGEQRITAATATTLQFATTASDGTAAGTISIKTAPAGWSRIFTGANKAVYKSSDPQSTGKFLRIDDSDAYYTHPRGYGAMTDVDTGTDPFPSLTTHPNSKWRWTRKYGSGSYVWDFFADTRAFIYAPASYAGDDKLQASFFAGDIEPCYAPAPHDFLLTTQATRSYSSSIAGLGHSSSLDSGYVALAGSLSGLGDPPRARVLGGAGESYYSGVNSNLGSFPSAGGQLELAQPSVIDLDSRSSSVLRGGLVGVYYSPQRFQSNVFPRGSTVELGNKKLRAVRSIVGRATDAAGAAHAGKIFIDVLGPWR